MHSAFLRSIFVTAIALAAGEAPSASAQTSPNPDLEARCTQLTSFYDRYGAGRGENSDGARNLTRVAAGIDCEEGRYEKGIAAMEALLQSKQFDVPPPAGVAQQPASGQR